MRGRRRAPRSTSHWRAPRDARSVANRSPSGCHGTDIKFRRARARAGKCLGTPYTFIEGNETKTGCCLGRVITIDSVSSCSLECDAATQDAITDALGVVLRCAKKCGPCQFRPKDKNGLALGEW